MWAGMLHLLFGNFLIGLGEGLLLTWLFSVPKAKSISTMVLANYASAWVGGWFIRGVIVKGLPMDLNNGWKWFWVMVFVTYCMTLLLEWPFIGWCFRRTEQWFRRSLRASLVIQSVSYLLLFGWYWLASGTSLYTQMSIVEPRELALPESVLVYFISSRDGDVYMRPLAGGHESKIFRLQSRNDNDRLFIRSSDMDPKRWDLMACLETSDHRHPTLVVVRTNLLLQTVPDLPSPQPEPKSTWMNFGIVPRFLGDTSAEWKFWAGFWPVEGLHGRNELTHQQVRFSYETPFGAWTVRNAVHLTKDKILFQLGDNQICAFDPLSRRVALLWHGRGPLPVIEKAATQ